MRYSFVQQKNFPRLTLFFAGWGMDEHPFGDYSPAGRDLLVCYDYRSLDFDSALLRPYGDIRLVGWSMGVWAASVVLQHTDLPVRERIALNGTLTPVDDLRGIPRAIFEGTLEGLNDTSLEKFIRRMCLTKENMQAFRAARPRRSVEELKEELRRIGEQVRALPVPDFKWERAVIGRDDLIFTPSNQRNAWSGEAEITECDIPHYSEEMLRKILG